MRRSHANYEYRPLSQNMNDMEDENNRMADELKDKIHVLKSLSIDIGNEVKYQDKLLRDIDDDLDRTGGFLGNTMNRVLRLSKGSHHYYIIYLFLFSLFVFFLLYFIIKFRLYLEKLLLQGEGDNSIENQTKKDVKRTVRKPSEGTK